ncbi:MAG: hypothetical protein M3Q58_07970 [Bacteroidota bacterium]|nr:hypothetical protein [Bacteroidota bacterium]
MKKLFYPLVLLAAMVVFIGCTKDKRNANKIDGKTFNVESISIDGSNMAGDLPTVAFENCRIYKETCSGSMARASENAAFAWQFREKGDVFEISNQSEGANEITKLAISLSGIYNVEENKRGNFRISSSNTVGYPGQNVTITMSEN